MSQPLAPLLNTISIHPTPISPALPSCDRRSQFTEAKKLSRLWWWAIRTVFLYVKGRLTTFRGPAGNLLAHISTTSWIHDCLSNGFGTYGSAEGGLYWPCPNFGNLGINIGEPDSFFPIALVITIARDNEGGRQCHFTSIKPLWEESCQVIILNVITDS